MMLRLPLYQADAFTDRLFAGNPAAFVPLEDAFLPDALMQDIARENNLSETAFTVPREAAGHYDLRWFTPEVEIEFCGHATLATAHLLHAELGANFPLTFHTQIGIVVVEKSENGYRIKGPNYPASALSITEQMRAAFSVPLLEAFRARDNLYFVTDSPARVAGLDPDFRAIATLGPHGIGLTAQGGADGADFTSRLFFPAIDIDEDPVTGSAHCALGPYWAARLGKTQLIAHQASRRGGRLVLTVTDDAVYLTGHAVTYLRGEIFVNRV